MPTVVDSPELIFVVVTFILTVSDGVSAVPPAAGIATAVTTSLLVLANGV